MNQRKSWPKGVPETVDFPMQTVPENLIASTKRTPTRIALIFYGKEYSYSQTLRFVEQLSGYLQSELKVKPGEPVLLFMQNSPQFIISYYAILHAGGVVVPVNPMFKRLEVAYIQKDTNSRIVLCGSYECESVYPLLASGKVEHVIVADYREMADPNFDIKVPTSVVEPDTNVILSMGCNLWRDVINSLLCYQPVTRSARDLAVIIYSSGTTGKPKGCMHSHYNVMVTAVGGVIWHKFEANSISLATLPMFHVTGMQGAMNGPLYASGTIVIMVRWNREIAAELIQRYKITRWRSISTMAIDLVNDPQIANYDLSSLKAIGGGGAAMPAPVAHKLKELTGLDYLEGYGLSETMAATHLNPPDQPRAQCLGIPVFNVKSCVWSPEKKTRLPPNHVGEILIAGPQVFLGYWQNPIDTEDAFVILEGTRYLRTGDIGYVDETGFFYMVDRLKRMINVAGFKVWPAEVEAIMYGHPEIAEACVIASKHPRKGEAVKAIVVPNDLDKPPSPKKLMDWCESNMAAYKSPTKIELAKNLPKSGSGKVMWRALTAAEQVK